MDILTLGDLDIRDIGTTYQFAGAVWASADTWLLALFPHEEYPRARASREIVLPMTLAEWETFLRQTDLLETEILLTDASGKLAKAVLRKSQRQIDAHVQWNVFRRDGYACRYCGREGVPLTVDHIVLWERGGPTIPDNLLAACKPCNRDRGNTEYAEWLSSPRYMAKAARLSAEARQRNQDVLARLPELWERRVTHLRSR